MIYKFGAVVCLCVVCLLVGCAEKVSTNTFENASEQEMAEFKASLEDSLKSAAEEEEE